MDRMLEVMSSLEMSRQELVRLLQTGLQTDLQTDLPDRPGGTEECEADCDMRDTSDRLSFLLSSVSTSLRSDLCCRLPGPVASQLSQLTVSLVRLRTERARCEAEWSARLDSLVTSLPCLLTVLYSGPVSSSEVGEGLLLQASLSLPSSKLNFTHGHTGRALTVIVLGQDRKPETEVTVRLCGGQARHIKHFQADTREAVRRLREAGVDLVISGVGLPPTLRQALRTEDIAAVEHAGLEEARACARVLPVTPWDGRDQISQSNLYTAHTVETLLLGGRIMVRISQKDSHHLVIREAINLEKI